MRKIISFLKEARAELGKVIWPPRRRAVRLTAAVVVITVVFAGFIGAVDYGLSHGVQYILGGGQRSAKSPTRTQKIPAGTGSQPVQVPAGGVPPNQSNPQPPSK